MAWKGQDAGTCMRCREHKTEVYIWTGMAANVEPEHTRADLVQLGRRDSGANRRRGLVQRQANDSPDGAQFLELCLAPDRHGAFILPRRHGANTSCVRLSNGGIDSQAYP